MVVPIYDDQYAGPRWTYGLRNRPAMYATVPDGRIIGSDKRHDRFAHGTIDYPRKLTAKECYDYELTFLGPIDEARAIRRAAAVWFVERTELFGRSPVLNVDLCEEVGMVMAEIIYAQDHLEEVKAKALELFGEVEP